MTMGETKTTEKPIQLFENISNRKVRAEIEISDKGQGRARVREYVVENVYVYVILYPLKVLNYTCYDSEGNLTIKA